MARLIPHSLKLAALGTIVLWLAGCGTVIQTPDIVMGDSFRPVNFHRGADQLPPQIRRVALLPLAATALGGGTDTGMETLQPVLASELGKTRLFEVVPISSEQLRRWTGKETWTAEEPLPRNFLERVRTDSGCDAVMFARLTVYHPYPPPALGWSIKLVDGVDGRVWWSIDEVFDAAEPTVTNGARRYSQQHLQQHSAAPDSRAILQSPSRFGQYTLSTAFSTLPAR
ncbi:MAG TPA: hypothetical protein VHH73_13670 [Verrucomicrobiae bacterium]|nr:hypothetical protein [Verrucomicrobiae bacterium]